MSFQFHPSDGIGSGSEILQVQQCFLFARRFMDILAIFRTCGLSYCFAAGEYISMTIFVE
jgi:hypothetical protein